MTTLEQLYVRIDTVEKQMSLLNISTPELKRAILAVPISYPEEELVEEPIDTDSDSGNNNTTETKTTNKKRISGYIVFQRVMRDEAEQSIYDELQASNNTNITNVKPKQHMILKKLAAMWKEIEPEDKHLWIEEATKINANNNA
jgi:hypothetical protein|tara:strand:+ start:131 stop:562 length:432 start_codon:yes stop_codon:yes gene_type:complete